MQYFPILLPRVTSFSLNSALSVDMKFINCLEQVIDNEDYAKVAIRSQEINFLWLSESKHSWVCVGKLS